MLQFKPGLLIALVLVILVHWQSSARGLAVQNIHVLCQLQPRFDRNIVCRILSINTQLSVDSQARSSRWRTVGEEFFNVDTTNRLSTDATSVDRRFVEYTMKVTQ